jgi:RNA recognition motif-containing protein
VWDDAKLAYLQNDAQQFFPEACGPQCMNILVSNLSVNINNNDLVALFSAFGKVSYAAVVRDKKSGRSRGNAFLEMPFGVEGEQAINALNHTLLDGKEIIVQEIAYKAGEFNN